MSPHYQRPMMYNAANAAPYVHQPMMPQQHPVHYNPQAPQLNPPQDVAIPPSQPVVSAAGISATPLEDLPMQDQVNRKRILYVRPLNCLVLLFIHSPNNFYISHKFSIFIFSK